ncbi:CesT family type III secretion system chaperone [Pseudomonas indica]|uniref:Tir chaperone protein (CesT) family protein n=1 Tax=Pseudomonas indica TaxID=137658 RepID=A0A1G9IYC6_9PSED|nr:CesT family type III secretion system chaperone [Pseudomonas indica]SDL30257.1 Tir chaperone protein (CesT) family protein [Pseudomonas indica]
MQAERSFHLLVSHVLKQYGIDSQIEAKDNEAYVLTLNEDLEVHLIGMQRGYLNLVSVLGEVAEDCSTEILRTLLRVNVFDLSHPVFAIGMTQAPNKIVLSTRQALPELDMATAYKLVETFIEKARGMREWLKFQSNARHAPVTASTNSR